MHKAWLVAKHEYLHNVKKRSFLFGAFGVPIVIVALIVIVGAIAVDSETNIEQVGMVGYVDEAGILSEAID
ncbi:MAG TPA: hypothetical protein VK003_15715, partial [Oceanobacillus sp.]|nr:hypothetical protein [Oceanobacillus sp.]